MHTKGYSGGIQGVFRGYSGGIQGVFRGYSGGILIEMRLLLGTGPRLLQPM